MTSDDTPEPTPQQQPEHAPDRPAPEIKPDPGLLTVDERGAGLPFSKEHRSDE